MKIADTVDDYLASYATRIAASTLAVQRVYMRQFVEWTTNALLFDLRAVTREHIEQYQTELRTRELARSSRAARFNAMRRFFALDGRSPRASHRSVGCR